MFDTSMRVVEKRRDLPAFTATRLCGAGKFVVRRGEAHQIQLRGAAAELARLRVEVVDGTLVVRRRPRVWLAPWICVNPPFRRGIEAVITVPTLERLHASGAVNVMAESISCEGDFAIGLSGSARAALAGVTASRFRFAASGACRLDLAELDATDASVSLSGSGRARLVGISGGTLRLTLSGAGVVDAAGTVESLDVRMSGAGKLRAATLKAADAAIRLSGAGKVAVWATGQLEVNASGAGRVEYVGNPILRQRLSGAIRIRPLRSSASPAQA